MYEGITPDQVKAQIGTAPSNPTNCNQPSKGLPFAKGYIQKQIRVITTHY